LSLDRQTRDAVAHIRARPSFDRQRRLREGYFFAHRRFTLTPLRSRTHILAVDETQERKLFRAQEIEMQPAPGKPAPSI
jgi:hypothetical protein